VSLTYIILAHRLPVQLARLVSTLYQSDDLFLIHIDAKVRPDPFVTAIHEACGPMSNIEFVEPVRCDWAGFGHVKATLRGIDRALSRESNTTHVLLLTGQDYPIKSLDGLRSHFAENAGKSYLSWSMGDDPSLPPDRRGNRIWFWDGNLDRLELRHYLFGRRWVHLPNRFLPFLPRRAMPLGMRPFQGLAYWSLSIEAARFVQQRVAHHPDLMKFFGRAFGSDEFFFQMILLNSPLKNTLVNEDLHFMNWEGYHPLIIRTSEFDALARSSKLFARKFDSIVDREVLDRIDSDLL
jgi:hypothetical protein